jgi:hypothetical protein
MGEYLYYHREGFEAWIRKIIGSDFRWKVRPRDKPSNRKMITDLIQDTMKRNNGVFPKSDGFIERVDE